MTLHPLAQLRAAAGLSHPAYARLVAETHAALGLGQMAARREKVSRWESGRTVPEHSAQLAMAHIHHVPATEVCRLGWPHWLYLASRDAGLLSAPHTDEGAALVLDSTLNLADAPRPPALLLTGRVLAEQVQSALVRLAEAADGAVTDVTGPLTERLDWAQARIEALEECENGTLLPLHALYTAALSEHRHLVTLITATPGGLPVPRLLYGLAARTGMLCAWLSSAAGEETRAERHVLAALRAAAASGSRPHTAAALTRLALRHLLAGSPADALSLLRAARAADPRPAPGTDVQLHGHRALALAHLADRAAARQALDHASRAVNRSATAAEMAARHHAVAVNRALASLYLGQPKTARRQFGPLTERLTTPQSRPPSPYTAQWLRYAVETHLALGEVDVAVHATHRALDLTGALPEGLALQFHQVLGSRQHEPLVRQALDRLRDLQR
ncbi:hypothetical protein EF910_00380 [Streptomyces sp. WAC07149]|uniref:hypothetical protein n=1 Tax=Streptomyces sp. WAC07149 TaxID=2487425 RepID=UPI000F7B0F54|nr:hypothetical protein [Streptomyces sp. WAC07149]RST08742.1 hypothetical protein EF910_00380 [Streptomyces sp. WAC07149]